jgi:hypothetical protein
MLSPEELATLEATLLPALERHHLRLLAHGLRTLQSIAARGSGPLPSREVIHYWALQQPATAADKAFAEAFSLQMEALGVQLKAIAGADGEPLALALADLIRWAQNQADHRLAGGIGTNPG